MTNLKLSLAILIMALLIVVPMGCILGSITGSGNLTTEEKSFSGFTEIEAHYGFQVEIISSSTFSIEITADDNIQKYIEVTKDGGRLKIGMESPRNYNSVTLKARITMPDLYEIDLSGGSRASVTGFNSSHHLKLELSGGSRITGDITAGDADFDLSGGSQVDLAGSADDLRVDASGGSQLDQESFSVDNADMNISGGGRATVNVTGTLDVYLSGGSKVEYIGEPNLGDVDLSGDSTVSKK